jgi:cytochrome c oxidase cbb3-type subunit I/II
MTVAQSRKEKADLSDPEYQAYPLTSDAHDEPLPEGRNWHYKLEGKPLLFTALTLIAVVVGGVVEIIPMIAVASNVPSISSVKPYTALELEGRDIYIREGCYTCHSQMVRPFREEVVRYGEYSKSGEFVYDHPFQFGSKRTGPDLHRVGGKYPNAWHYRHMIDPRSTSAGSIMPAYSWLANDELDTSLTKNKLKVMKSLGVPYSQNEIDNAVSSLEAQSKVIADDLRANGAASDQNLEKKEIIAMIAYLQKLGSDIKVK